MANNNYIVALELGSSKASGAIAVENYEGTNIIAYASEPVNGFISKGVVRNIDETGKCLTSIINKLETQLDGANICKAYVALNGLSLKSVKSTVKREFGEYTKITQEIIDSMALENDYTFVAPTDYEKVDVITQEYKMGGDTSLNPIGMSVKSIESNYLNIIIKEQYMRLLEESMKLAKIEIVDSFTAATICATTILNDDEKREGCALVDIGAETTTVTIYSNNLLRKLCVLPLGSANITRDLQAEHISQADAETLKIHAGYKAESFGESSIGAELRDNIIGARMIEILQNVNHQIKNSGENITNAIFTGGGAKLKNIEKLLADTLPEIRIRIATDPFVEFNVGNNLQLKRGEPNATLLGLLKCGKENCCQDPATKEQPIMKDIFAEVTKEEPAPINTITDNTETTEEKEQPEKTEKPKKPKATKEKGSNFLGTLFTSFGEKVKQTTKDFLDNATREDEEDDYNDDDSAI